MEQTVPTRTGTSSIEEPIRGYFQGLNASDPDRIASVFAEDGSLLADEFPTVTGREQIRTMFRQQFQAISLQRELHVDRVREDGDTAAVETHTTGTITMNGNQIPMESRELFLLKRNPNGWEITDYMFNRPAHAGE